MVLNVSKVVLVMNKPLMHSYSCNATHLALNNNQSINQSIYLTCCPFDNKQQSISIVGILLFDVKSNPPI